MFDKNKINTIKLHPSESFTLACAVTNEKPSILAKSMY